MKKVRNKSWHAVLIDALKTETSNFVLNPSLHFKPVEGSEQSCCMHLHAWTYRGQMSSSKSKFSKDSAENEEKIILLTQMFAVLSLVSKERKSSPFHKNISKHGTSFKQYTWQR